MSDRVSFLDTNVLLRHLLQDHSDHSPRATSLIREIERGSEKVRVADTVIFEAAYTLEKTYGIARDAISIVLLEFLDLPNVLLTGKTIFYEVFDVYVRNLGLSIADCYHIAIAKQLTGGSLISFDRKVGKVEGITRIEP